MSGQYFEATTSELNQLKIKKILDKLNYFSGEIDELIRHHKSMLTETGKESHYAYESCMETLEKLKDDYLTQDHNLDCAIREALFLLKEEYGPADQKGI